MVSGRFSVRLIADGAMSFAFVPTFDVAALGVVCLTGPRARRPFAWTVDRFFAGNAAWLVWMAILAGVFAAIPPRYPLPLFGSPLLTGLVPLVWCACGDFRFFRSSMERSPAGAWRDLALHRLILWTSAVSYFFGIALWHEYVPQVVGWFMR
jgi:hypothetical protein